MLSNARTQFGSSINIPDCLSPISHVDNLIVIVLVNDFFSALISGPGEIVLTPFGISQTQQKDISATAHAQKSR